MIQKEIVEKVRERARRNFSKGFNCSECIFEAVLSCIDTGLPMEMQKMATGFGGGTGLFGDTCGAIAGAVLSVSAVHGRSGLPEGGDKHDIARKAVDELYGKPGLYRLFNQVPNRIKEKYGNTLCREITSEWRDTWLCRDHALYCRELITDAAGIAAKLILEDKEISTTRAFGENVEHLKEEN